MSRPRAEHPQRTEGAAPRVCLLAESFHPNVDGGASHARSIATGFVRTGRPLFVLTPGNMPDCPVHEVIDGVEVTRFGPHGVSSLFARYWNMVTAAWLLWRRRRDWDLLLVSSLRVLGPMAVAMCKLLGRPCVLRIDTCGDMSGEYATPLTGGRGLRHGLARLYFGLRNRLVVRGDAFIAMSRPIRAEFEACGVRPEIIADITNGVDTAVFRPLGEAERARARAAKGLPEDAAIIAYSGRLTREKGLEVLLEAFRRVSVTRPGAHLLLVGSGAGLGLDCEPELRAFVQANGLGARVTFTGYVERVQEWVGLADVFALLSRTEALGLALLEAMACEVAPVASRVGGMLEIVEDGVNGRFVDHGDVEATTEVIGELLDDAPARRRMAAAARATVEARFALESIVEQYASLCEDVFAGRPVTRPPG